MAHSGYSVLIRPHDPANRSIREACRVCGRDMSVRLDVVCAGSWAQAIGGKKSSHDVFSCPDKDKPWHAQAELICVEASKTASPSLKRMLEQDAKDLCGRKTG